jgi:hypothetical protein
MRVLFLAFWFAVVLPVYSAQALTVADLLVPGTTASTGDLVFGNFSLIGPAGPSFIDVTLLPNGIRFDSPLVIPPTSLSNDFAYSVTSTVPLGMTTISMSGPDSITDSVLLYSSSAILGAIELAGNSSETISFPSSSPIVTLHHLSGTGPLTGSLTITETFSSVPEPSTVLMLITGSFFLTGLGVGRKLRGEYNSV